MARKSSSAATGSPFSSIGDRLPGMAKEIEAWEAQTKAVAGRFSKEYRGDTFDVPDEVQAMPIFQDWVSGKLQQEVATPFWDLIKPKKNQKCLDIGCGISFLIYPWRDWDALFWGIDPSIVAYEGLRSRGPQLNSKLFKSIERGVAHDLPHSSEQFDLIIATGWSCYYPLGYWEVALGEMKRVLKSDGRLVFDVLNPDAERAENWAILETYLGSEVFLESVDDWTSKIKDAGGKIRKTKEGPLFTGMVASF